MCFGTLSRRTHEHSLPEIEHQFSIEVELAHLLQGTPVCVPTSSHIAMLPSIERGMYCDVIFLTIK
jgi:hypothetical protein